jgi:AcrR family transcriptional regulator
MKRKYELKERALRQAETRQRIVEAAVGLHSTIGPARTTISAIAERAGVERHTVYAHFPDDRALFGACSRHWRLEHPLPDLAALEAIEDPEARLRQGLNELYGWYASVEVDLALFARDAYVLDAEVVTEGARGVAALGETIAAGWPRRKSTRAAIGHALEFETWRSLVRRQGLSRTQAVDTMMALISSQAR